MQYCARCLYSTRHPLGLMIDDDGVCSGCRVHEEKDVINWTERFESLVSIVNQYRNRSDTGYDCIVPISGAGDSYFIVDTVVRRLGLNPLLVSYNRHYNTPAGHRNIAYLRTCFDCDYYQQTLSTDLTKRIMLSTLEYLGSFHWHAIAGQTVLPVQCATRLKVPLVIWGAHQGLDQVGMFSHFDEVEMTRRYRKDHDLLGLEPEDLCGLTDLVSEGELSTLFYPDDRDLLRVGVRGIYLGNYIRWDSKLQHEQMIKRYGYETTAQIGTFDTYNHADCVHYGGLHDLVKRRKLGFGKAVDHVCREIRLRRLSRENGIEIVKECEANRVTDDDALFSWLGISKDDFWRLIDRQKRSWDHDQRFYAEPESLRKQRLEKVDDCGFLVSSISEGTEGSGHYHTISRGYSDSLLDRNSKINSSR